MCSALDKRSQRDFVKWIRQHGYTLTRQKGGHIVYTNEKIGHSIVINIHLNKLVMERLKKEIISKLKTKDC